MIAVFIKPLQHFSLVLYDKECSVAVKMKKSFPSLPCNVYILYIHILICDIYINVIRPCTCTLLCEVKMHKFHHQMLLSTFKNHDIY